MRNDIPKTTLVQVREEYLVIDTPTLAHAPGDEELLPLKERFNLTTVEAQIMWFLRDHEPVNLRLIPSHRTHLYNLRKKLRPFNIKIENCFNKQVYQLSIVEEIREVSDGAQT
jgi:hypothetical protein